MQFLYLKNLIKSKGRILTNNTQILELIKNDLNTNDSLMIKASNATGFTKIVNDFKKDKNTCFINFC